LGERYYQQEGKENLHPRESHPELVEQLDKLAVTALTRIFTVFAVHMSRITFSIKVPAPPRLT
jgi:hypothetical protein